MSYFTRSSNTYDALMQMGRWFGFRPGYLDACRLFTTPMLYTSFSHISMATEDLAAQFDFMNLSLIHISLKSPDWRLINTNGLCITKIATGMLLRCV